MSTLTSFADLFHQPRVSESEKTRRAELFAEIVHNALLSRKEWMQNLNPDRRRNLNDECGYPADVTAQMYQDMYDNEPIGNRVVKVWPKECWQVSPLVYEDEDSKVSTPFERAWDALGRQMRAETSWYKDERGSAVWRMLYKADFLSRVGSYGVIFLGIDDGQTDLSQPAEMFDPKDLRGKAPARKLLYARVFPESLAQIVELDSDPGSPRFTHPLRYQLTFNDPSQHQTGLAGASTATRDVHWTRIVHVADNTESSEVWGVPAQKPVWRRLYDLQKTYGGSAEMYWRGALPGWAVQSHPTLGANTSLDLEGLKDMFEDWGNGLQRFLAIVGGTVESLAPQVSSPKEQIDAYLQAIAICLDIPMRILMGSERGQLASAQDAKSWGKRIAGRQWGHCNPGLVIPLADRLINLSVLPAPEAAGREPRTITPPADSPETFSITETAGGYSIFWPDLAATSDAEKADVAMKKTQALATYVSGGVDSIYPIRPYLTNVFGDDDDVAARVLDVAMEQADSGTTETGGSPLLALVGGIEAMVKLFEQFKAGAMSEESLKQIIMIFYKVDEETAKALIADGLPPPTPEQAAAAEAQAAAIQAGRQGGRSNGGGGGTGGQGNGRLGGSRGQTGRGGRGGAARGGAVANVGLEELADEVAAEFQLTPEEREQLYD